MIDKQEAGLVIEEIRRSSGLSWQSLAERTDRPIVWLTAAVLGMHPVPAAEAEILRHALGLADHLVDALTRQPNRALTADISSDPTIYRFHEIVQVYGAALKAVIHEEFGDGIMSAINCSISVERAQHQDGDRVRVVIDGKFLAYDWVETHPMS